MASALSFAVKMRRVLNSLLGLLALGAVFLIVICIVLYLTQERSIFFPRPNEPAVREQLSHARIEIRTDNAMLEGWWLENPGADMPLVILYFGGNAEDVLYTAATSAPFNARRMLFVNYRGYGGSTGEPSQSALYEDALAIYDYALRQGAQPEQIVVMGRSLGSGVATMLAAHRTIRGAVLITPFDSLAAVAARHYPFVPVRWLLRHPFPSDTWARKANAPALFLAAEHDFVVPAVHAQKLFEAWAGQKRIQVLDGTGHNDIHAHPDYYRLVNEFLESL